MLWGMDNLNPMAPTIHNHIPKERNCEIIWTSKLASANSATRFDKLYFLKCYVSIIFSLSILIHYPFFWKHYNRCKYWSLKFWTGIDTLEFCYLDGV
jgi:hypothetical protein